MAAPPQFQCQSKARMKITQRAYGRDYYPLRLNLTGQSRFVLPTVAHLNASRWSGPGAMRETFTRGDASDASAMQSDHRSAEYKRVRLRSFALLVIFSATAQGQSVHDLFGGISFTALTLKRATSLSSPSRNCHGKPRHGPPFHG